MLNKQASHFHIVLSLFTDSSNVIYLAIQYKNALNLIFTDVEIVQKKPVFSLVNAPKVIYSKVETKNLPRGNTPDP
jgi:hypothetical protein